MADVRAAIRRSADDLRRAADRIEKLAAEYDNWKDENLVDLYLQMVPAVLGLVNCSGPYRALLDGRFEIGSSGEPE